MKTTIFFIRATTEILFLLFSSYECFEWDPKQLVNLTPSNLYPHLYDPENYQNSSTYLEEIEYYIDEIKRERGFDVYIYSISFMDRVYNDNIERFTNDIVFYKFNKALNMDYDTLFIVFSYGNRLNRIRTGRNVKFYITDSKCKDLLDDLRPILNENDYSKALVQLLRNLSEHISKGKGYLDIKENESNDNTAYYFSVPMGILIYVVPYLYKLYKGKSPVEKKLEKIQKIVREKKRNKEVIDTYCLVCLDKFDPDEETTNNITRGNSNNTYNSIPNHEVKRIECGHIFHQHCIESWFHKHNQCPVCKENIDSPVSFSINDPTPFLNEHNTRDSGDTRNNRINDPISKSLVNIQIAMNPEMSGINFTHSNTDFSWSYPTSGSDDNNNTTSSSDDGPGGASSSW